MDKVRRVAGEVLFKNGHMARDWRRSASMIDRFNESIHVRRAVVLVRGMTGKNFGPNRRPNVANRKRIQAEVSNAVVVTEVRTTSMARKRIETMEDGERGG